MAVLTVVREGMRRVVVPLMTVGEVTVTLVGSVTVGEVKVTVEKTDVSVRVSVLTCVKVTVLLLVTKVLSTWIKRNGFQTVKTRKEVKKRVAGAKVVSVSTFVRVVVVVTRIVPQVRVLFWITVVV